jgi:hypothetical protein
MGVPDLSRAEWRTSSYSGSNSNCVEVAAASRARVLLRDTKDREGSVLTFPPNAWERFAQRVKANKLLT